MVRSQTVGLQLLAIVFVKFKISFSWCLGCYQDTTINIVYLYHLIVFSDELLPLRCLQSVLYFGFISRNTQEINSFILFKFLKLFLISIGKFVFGDKKLLVFMIIYVILSQRKGRCNNLLEKHAWPQANICFWSKSNSGKIKSWQNIRLFKQSKDFILKSSASILNICLVHMGRADSGVELDCQI